MPACAIYTYPQSSYARLNRQQAQQAVDVDDEIARLRVVNGAFCLALCRAFAKGALVAALDPTYHPFSLPDK